MSSCNINKYKCVTKFLVISLFITCCFHLENRSHMIDTLISYLDKFPIEVKFIPGSYDFQIIERDAVIVTGTATIPEEKLLNNYFKKDTEKNDNSDIPTDLVTADLYKNYRLKGFEYGPAFQVLLGSTIEGKS